MKNFLSSCLFVLLSLSGWAQTAQTFVWNDYPGVATSKVFTLQTGWSGSVTVLAFNAPNGRTIAASTQPLVTKDGNDVTVSFTPWMSARLSASTYLEIATGGTVRFKGYLYLSTSYTPPVNLPGGGISAEIQAALALKVTAVAGSRLMTEAEGTKLAGLSNSGGGTGSAASQFVPLFVVYGESNAAGASSNTALSGSELAVRPSVKIINNTTLALESLQISVNNYQDASGITSVNHGWEASLANAVEANKFTNNPVYLVKAGQGGAGVNTLVKGSAYWNKLSIRVDSMKANIRRLGKIPITYVLYSQGINDGIAGTSITTWKTQTAQLFKDIRGKLGYVPIIATNFSATGFAAYNVAYSELQANDPFLFMVDITGATYQDTYHWDAAGMKTIGSRMWNIVTNTIGQNQEYQLSQAGALAGAAPVSSGTATGGSSGTVTTYGTSSCGNSYTYATYTNLVNATASGTGLDAGNYWVNNTSNTASGGTVANSILSATACFEAVMQLDNATAGSAVIMYLDATQADTYVDSGKSYGIAAMFIVGTTVYKKEGTSFSSIGTTSYPCKLRFRRNGTSVEYEKSENGGAWAPLYTGTNKLASQTNLYVKVLQSAAGGQKVAIATSK